MMTRPSLLSYALICFIAALGFILASGYLAFAGAEPPDVTEVAPDGGPYRALYVDAGVPDTASTTATSSPRTDAPTVVSDEDILREQFENALHGKSRGRAIAVLFVVGFVYVARRFGTREMTLLGYTFRLLPQWFDTDRGGVALAFLTSAGGAIGNAMAADVPITPELFEAAFWVGVAAAGAYVVARRLHQPKDVPVAAEVTS